jgi:hypothetical protein
LSSAKEIFQFIRDFFATHWLFIHSGTMHKITKLDKAPASMLLMPLFLALGAIFLGLVSFVLLLASWAVPYLPTINPAPQFPVTQVATYSIACTIAWIIGMTLLERHWHMLWVMRSYIFTGLHARGLAPEIEGRLNHIAEQIRQQIARHAYDEILLVGHSTGSIMATLTLSRLFEKIPNHPTIGLLTLGQWWPWLGYLPSAQFAQDRLRHVASQTELTWIDVSAAADGCCFSFIDPLVTLADPPSPCIRRGGILCFPSKTIVNCVKILFAFTCNTSMRHLSWACVIFSQSQRVLCALLSALPMSLLSRLKNSRANAPKLLELDGAVQP